MSYLIKNTHMWVW